MDMHTMGSESGQAQEDILQTVAPLLAAWQKACFDLPLAVLAETLRFAGQRLQAHGDFLANLRSCRSVPDIVDAQSEFMRAAADDYGTQTGEIIDDIRLNVDRAA